MSTFQQYFSVIGIFQGCLLFILLVTDSRLSSASLVLGVLCLCLALLLFLPFVMTNEQLQPAAWLAGWIFYLPASLGGLGYIYCRNSILNKPFNWRDLIHIAPLVICYLLTAEFLIYSQSELWAWVAGVRTKSWRLIVSEYVIFAQAFFYSGITALLVMRYQRRAHTRLANFNPTTFKWLWGFVLIGFSIWCVKAFMAFSPHVSTTILYVSDILIVIFIYFVAMSQWKNPQLFTINQLPEEKRAQESAAKTQREVSAGALDSDTRANLFKAIKDQIEEQDLYRDSELTLSSLAEATGLSTHHLSEVLNQYEGKNFYQFINGYRVAHVCERLEKDTSGKILDIAMEAGFASKSTFNSIFKKFTGSTPSQYRRTLAA